MYGAQNPLSFGALLKAERKALGKKQVEIAHATGLRRQTVADIESGKNVKMHAVFSVLAALGKVVVIDSPRPSAEMIRQILEQDGDD